MLPLNKHSQRDFTLTLRIWVLLVTLHLSYFSHLGASGSRDFLIARLQQARDCKIAATESSATSPREKYDVKPTKHLSSPRLTAVYDRPSLRYVFPGAA